LLTYFDTDWLQWPSNDAQLLGEPNAENELHDGHPTYFQMSMGWK
jgi:hypothetical protein